MTTLARTRHRRRRATRDAAEPPALTLDERTALLRFATDHGPTWREALAARWGSCTLYLLGYGEVHIGALARLKFTLGPSGLMRYQPPCPTRRTPATLGER